MRLSELKIDQNATITWIHTQGEIVDQLLEMGLTPGTSVALIRRGPFGNPLELLVRGYRLSIHKKQASTVEVTL